MRRLGKGAASAASQPDVSEPQLDPSAVELVLDAPRRVRPIPLWRLRLVAFATQFVLLVAISTWLMSTDEVTAFAGFFLGVHPLKRVETTKPDIGLVVRAPAGEVTVLASELSNAGIHASFTDNGVDTPSTIAGFAHLSRRARPRSAPFGLALALGPHTRDLALTGASAGLAPPLLLPAAPEWLTVGQLVLARTAGALPVAGAERLERAQARSPITGCARAMSSSSRSTDDAPRSWRWSASSPGCARRGSQSSRSAPYRLTFHQSEQER